MAWIFIAFKGKAIAMRKFDSRKICCQVSLSCCWREHFKSPPGHFPPSCCYLIGRGSWASRAWRCCLRGRGRTGCERGRASRAPSRGQRRRGWGWRPDCCGWSPDSRILNDSSSAWLFNGHGVRECGFDLSREGFFALIRSQLTHISQFPNRKLPQSISGEREGEDTCALKLVGEVRKGHSCALNRAQVISWKQG